MNGHDEIFDLQNYLKRLIPKGRKKFLLIIALFLGFIVIPKSITIVPAGHVGLKDFFGNVSDRTLSAGLHLVNPLLKIHKMTIQPPSTEGGPGLQDDWPRLPPSGDSTTTAIDCPWGYGELRGEGPLEERHTPAHSCDRDREKAGGGTTVGTDEVRSQ